MSRNHHILIKSFLNGTLCALILHIILMLYASNLVYNWIIFISFIILGILISVFINHIFINTLNTANSVKKFFLFSWLLYFGVFIIILIIKNSINLDFFPQREVSASEGIGLILMILCFRLIYIISVFIQLLKRIGEKTHQSGQSGDGSLFYSN